ncbi:MAG: hypothetical protein WC069_02985 [Candidatus Shapirobacteria bacterium]
MKTLIEKIQSYIKTMDESAFIGVGRRIDLTSADDAAEQLAGGKGLVGLWFTRRVTERQKQILEEREENKIK